MKKTLEKVIFFGNERLATGVTTPVDTLKRLLEAGYEVVAVVTNYEVGVSRKSRELEIEQVARQHNIPVLFPAKPGDILQQLQSYAATAGILVAYGRIIPQAVIDVFPRGIINIHPSLLPLHRGPTPIESVLREGATKTGVCIMQLAQKMDAGPVYGYSELPLTGMESKQQLADTLLDLGSQTLLQLLPGIVSGEIVGQPQTGSPSYDQLISKTDGTIDWDKPAIQIEREIRAYLTWPGSHTTLGDKQVIITKAHVIQGSAAPGALSISKNELAVGCGSDMLAIDSLKPAGKAEMSIAGFLAGYRDILE